MVNKEGGPKIEPCGSPYMILYIVLYDNQIFVLSFRFRNQQSGFIFNAGNDSPLACSFATSKS